MASKFTLLCFYRDHGPGETIELDDAEADRLEMVGAGVIVERIEPPKRKVKAEAETKAEAEA
jgi:hypothetical protein